MPTSSDKKARGGGDAARTAGCLDLLHGDAKMAAAARSSVWAGGVLAQDSANVERAHAYNGLVVAALGLEDALLAGRDAEPELQALRSAADAADPFAAAMLASLPPGCTRQRREDGTVATESAVQQKLAAELDGLVAAAFVPPGGGLLGELVGQLFRKAYVLDPAAAPLEPSTPQGERSEVRSNLEALAGVLGGRGDLAARLQTLEGSLGGLCRERAASWLSEARDALVLQQTLRAVKARAQCLNSVLL
ncbi:unnamed protein product [Prorocentrum cordatum]|uniref:Uncharacterized protein n=1 Tax=Prorocentrum cordatum TaxID=2364126 RepID=A0ABN9VX90_9DINO|nr:unnamed protein product [Polarella glacialis]